MLFLHFHSEITKLKVSTTKNYQASQSRIKIQLTCSSSAFSSSCTPKSSIQSLFSVPLFSLRHGQSSQDRSRQTRHTRHTAHTAQFTTSQQKPRLDHPASLILREQQSDISRRTNLNFNLSLATNQNIQIRK